MGTKKHRNFGKNPDIHNSGKSVFQHKNTKNNIDNDK